MVQRKQMRHWSLMRMVTRRVSIVESRDRKEAGGGTDPRHMITAWRELWSRRRRAVK